MKTKKTHEIMVNILPSNEHFIVPKSYIEYKEDVDVEREIKNAENFVMECNKIKRSHHDKIHNVIWYLKNVIIDGIVVYSKDEL